MSTSRRKKPAYHHGDLRTALLQSAGYILEKQGVASLRTREVARRAGVSHNAPFRHFPSRAALLAALAEEGFGALGHRLKEAAPRGGRALGETYVAFALEHPQRFRLMFGGELALERDPGLREQASRAYAVLLQAFSWVGAERDVQNAAAAAWALVHGLAQLLLDGHLRHAAGEDPGSFARDVIGAMRFAVGAQRSA